MQRAGRESQRMSEEVTETSQQSNVLNEDGGADHGNRGEET